MQPENRLLHCLDIEDKLRAFVLSIRVLHDALKVSINRLKLIKL